MHANSESGRSGHQNRIVFGVLAPRMRAGAQDRECNSATLGAQPSQFCITTISPLGLKCGETRGAPLALACHRFPGLAWSWVCTFGESLVF
jgi:hypothetical protein